MAPRTATIVLCLGLASCSDVNPTVEAEHNKTTPGATVPDAPILEPGPWTDLTVQRARAVIQETDSRIHFAHQGSRLPSMPEVSILYATLEEDGLRATFNIGSRVQAAKFTHLKIVLEAREGGPPIAQRYVDKYVAGFLRKAIRTGDTVWTELLQQSDLLGVAGKTSLIQRVETEHCFVTLARSGNVPASEYQRVDFEITTRDYQKELDAQIQRFMPSKK